MAARILYSCGSYKVSWHDTLGSRFNFGKFRFSRCSPWFCSCCRHAKYRGCHASSRPNLASSPLHVVGYLGFRSAERFAISTTGDQERQAAYIQLCAHPYWCRKMVRSYQEVPELKIQAILCFCRPLVCIQMNTK